MKIYKKDEYVELSHLAILATLFDVSGYEVIEISNKTRGGNSNED